MLRVNLRRIGCHVYEVANVFLRSRNTLIHLVSKLLPGASRLKVLGLPSGIETKEKFKIIPVYEEAPVEVSVPEPIERQFRKNYEGQYFPERSFPECFVMCLEYGISSRKGFNMANSGRLIPEATFEIGQWKRHDFSILRRPKLFPEFKEYKHSVATLTSPWQSNYFHWLFDILPRFHLIEQAGLKADKFFVEYEHSFQKETLGLLGYNDEQIINANKIEFISAASLIVPSLPGVPGIMPAWACQFLRQKFIPAGSGTHPLPSLLYISRGDASRRKISNEQDLISLLEPYGFVTVKLEGLSFLDQVRLFGHARVVVAGHGAGLANLVFCRKATKVVELFSPTGVNACYFDLSQQIGLDYNYLMGEDQVSSEGPSSPNQKCDIRVNLNELKAVLESTFSSPLFERRLYENIGPNNY
jgi:hypothetical protein